MMGINQLVDQHFKEYESRMKQMDELLVSTTAAFTPAVPAISEHLATIIEERNKFVGHINELRAKSLEHWQTDHIAKSGPMAVWDIVAQQLEKAVESVEQK